MDWLTSLGFTINEKLYEKRGQLASAGWRCLAPNFGRIMSWHELYSGYCCGSLQSLKFARRSDGMRQGWLTEDTPGSLVAMAGYLDSISICSMEEDT